MYFVFGVKFSNVVGLFREGGLGGGVGCRGGCAVVWWFRGKGCGSRGVLS